MPSITMLGTSGSAPTKERALPSMAIEYEGSVYLFDCGEGTQSQLLKYSISPAKIDNIFVSHVHGDHIIGIAGLVRTLALNNRAKPLTIFVPRRHEGSIRALLTFDRAILKYPITVKGIKSGEIIKDRDITISAFRLNHSISTYGFVFKVNDRLRFDKERCRKLGIKGVMFSELQKKGSLKVNGKTIRLKSITTLKKGKKVVYVADTRPSKEAIKASRDADILIHEATYTEQLKELARQRKHSTAREAATIARLSKSRMLVLFHISARYKSTNVLLNEAKIVFKNTRMAYDGMKIPI